LVLQLSAARTKSSTAARQGIANPIRFLNWTPPHAAPISAFVHVGVIPMNKEGSLQDCTVVVRDGHILAIGPAGKTPIPSQAQLIDGRGKYLIPGLIDMRVHIYSPGEMLLYLANGITTVRNLNGRPQHLLWRDKINAGKMFGPTILTAGPLIDTVETAAQGKKLVMEQSRAGYDAIDIGANVSAEAFQSIATTARALGVLLFGPVNANVGLKGTVRAPQFFSVERVGQFAALLFKGNPDTPEASVSEAAAEIQNARLWFAPSLVSSANAMQEVEDLPRLLRQPEIRYLPPWAQHEWSSPHNSWPKNLGSEKAAVNRRNFSFDKRIVSVMHREGVPMILGTDAMEVGTVPGFSVEQELANLVEAGLTPFEALQTATRNASDWFVHPEGGGIFGTITPGERADLVLLDADPLADIANVSKIQGVMVQGRWLPKAEIERMLEALPVAYSAEKKFLTSIAQNRPDTLDKYLYEDDPFHKLTNEVMLDLIITKGIGALKQVYSRLQDVDRTSIALEEATVDDLGFQLLDLNRDSDAIQLFLSNVQTHPASARAYDSLAQAYLKSGNRSKALQYFAEAQRVDASFKHAREALADLRSQDEEK
jgi:tetratricopeptide (TPR) repeat protein